MMPESPFDRDEILQALSQVETAVTSFFGSLSDEEFVLRVEEAWSPAEHLMHLNTSVSAVARGVSIRPWILRLRFGRARAPSRRYDELRAFYRARLAEGVRATGPYVPPREEVTGASVSAYRSEVLARWKRVNERLRGAMGGWSERQMERIRLPHPLLGKLSVREMLFFTLYHNQHHIEAAKRRLPRFSGGAPAA